MYSSVAVLQEISLGVNNEWGNLVGIARVHGFDSPNSSARSHGSRTLMLTRFHDNVVFKSHC
jgi:hypothetical protein